MWSLNIETDVLPVTLFPGEYVDYAGEFIGRQLTIPMLSGHDPANTCLIQSCSSENNFRQWTLTLHPDVYWSDGRNITALNLVLALENMRKGRTAHQWLAGLLDTTQYAGGYFQHDTYEITIYFTYPLVCFPEILDSIFVPVPEPDQLPDVSSGPYKIHMHIPGNKGMVLHKTGMGRQMHPGPDQVVFALTAHGREGIHLFEQGLIHMTANTTFPGELVSRYRHREEFHSRPTSLAGHLQFNPDRCPHLVTSSVKKKLSALIRREYITQELNGLVNPLYRYTDIWNTGNPIPVPEQVEMQEFPDLTGETYSILYADFAPNGYIVSQIAHDFSAATGAVFIPQPVTYAQYFHHLGNRDYDIVYALQPAPFDDPLAFFLPWLPLFPGEEMYPHGWKEDLLHILTIEDKTLRTEAVCRLENRLSGWMPAIPVISVNSVYLSCYPVPEYICTHKGYIHLAGLPAENTVRHTSYPPLSQSI